MARAAGIDQAHLSRIESGVARASVDVLVAISAVLGADLALKLFAGSGPRLHDRFQAPMVEALIRILDRRWIARPEVPVHEPARGVIDVVITSRTEDVRIAAEVQSELRRLEATIRTSSEKAASVPPNGLHVAPASRLLLCRSTMATRELARQFEATLAAAYPARAADAYAALTTADRPWPGPAVLWVRLDRGTAEVLDRPPRGVHLGR